MWFSFGYKLQILKNEKNSGKLTFKLTIVSEPRAYLQMFVLIFLFTFILKYTLIFLICLTKT